MQWRQRGHVVPGKMREDEAGPGGDDNGARETFPRLCPGRMRGIIHCRPMSDPMA